MELLQWLRSILRRSLRAKDTALRWLFTILRLLLHSINRGKNPSDKDTPPSNASQSLDPIGNTVVICPSELPAHTPYAANIDASKSPEIAETTRIQRSRNETPSQFPSALTPPSPCTLDPSSTGNKHSGVHASAMFTALEASTYEPNIESSPDLDLSQQTLRGGTPSTASIRTRTTSARSTSRRQSATPPQDGTEAPDAAALPSPQTHCTPAVSERPALALSSQNQAFWSIAPERLMRYDRIEENLM
ncbi:hypothetical protein CYLTODRAFT_107001 [Cylindrobasidium torrendii FP15055 ss-10]|uniref:Uncharacterized protein n=1 Tax=Cylindrobasidium torrendii FP15055 ss-10 TaxID=1314674 RepID=A0A0D7B288_9AGAR|nr:hypothetical protein CYLTODRAFT_107001 [Cylindrobasidium torrendii FP15055 ss-10]